MTGPRHLEEVPSGASYAAVAKQTDAAIWDVMSRLRADNPGLGGAVLAGALSAATRYQLQAMPETTAAFQVLQVMAPLIQSFAGQMVDARAKRKGVKPPTIGPADPQQSAFDRLRAFLTSAPVPTFVLWHEEVLVLVSLDLGVGFVRSHATRVDVEETMRDPGTVVDTHCIAALSVWATQGMGADTREALFRNCQTLFAGHDAEMVLNTVCDCLALAVGVAVSDLEAGDRLLDELLPDIKVTLRDNWEGIEQTKAGSRG